MGNNSKPKADYNVAMGRLVVVAAFGCLLVLVYGLSGAHKDLAGSFGTDCLGLMAGGAALLTGGLLGFVFGIPHTRLREEDRPQTGSETTKQESTEQEKRGSRSPAANYRPNTSLEQISDWLTKMLVGVTLVEVKNIPGALRGAASYFAAGMSSGEHAETFVLAVLIYFSVDGFVFGFLWARLYLPRWFAEADEMKQLEEKVSRLEERQQEDARALVLVSRLLNPDEGNEPTSEKELVAAIKAASGSTREQILYQSQRASEDTKAPDYQAKIRGVISILKALIASDAAERDHRYHIDLSHAFDRMTPPDWKMAGVEAGKAIEIRDKRKLKGWKYYEFNRARCLIKQDVDFDNGRQSKAELIERVVADLRVAFSEREKWPKWATPDSTVRKWMVLNGIDDARLKA
jgi:hypothetical protein